jgi:hypothetical protein
MRSPAGAFSRGAVHRAGAAEELDRHTARFFGVARGLRCFYMDSCRTGCVVDSRVGRTIHRIQRLEVAVAVAQPVMIVKDHGMDEPH